MALWRREGFVDNVWSEVADGDSVPASGAIVVSAKRWSAERETLSGRADPVGVSIAAAKEAVDQLGEVAGRPLVVLDFAKFADGRAFSYAELLRERHGFTGELRAGGDVLLDEIPLMLRCGFDSFEIANEPTLRALKRGHLPGVSLFYQPSVEPGEVPAGTRPWLRRRIEA
jgi:uncharacterized protein (DUF934 family)